MRLFIGVRPPEPVLDRVGELVDGLQAGWAGSRKAVRWTTRDQWHMTLRFLGEVDDPDPVAAALEGADLKPAEACAGPGIEVLGRQVLCIPVRGLDALANQVVEATSALGRPPDMRPFHGHLTLARLKGGAFRGDLSGSLGEADWTVDRVVLVRSRLGRGGARYDDLHVRHLDDA